MKKLSILCSTNKKTIIGIMFTLIAILVMAFLIGILFTGCNSIKSTLTSEQLTSNIDKYYADHKIADIIADRGNSPEQVAANKKTMTDQYGENKEINGQYNEKLAAKTQTGTYVGKSDSNNVVSWKGIPYAKAPVGDLRWKAPEQLDKNEKVFEAYYNGHSSLQFESNSDFDSLYPQGEDCLNLNVWNNSTDKSKNKPIMVWIHGGAYIQGGTVEPQYDGTNIVKDNPDVIYASMDYRTDFMGFINLTTVEGAGDYKNSANLGILDEIAALKWLKENAQAFGGDPNNITIFGESAGGGSVSVLTIIPEAKDLFKRAIIQSGSSTRFLRTKDKSIAHTNKILEISGAKNIEDLKLLSASDIQKIESIIITEDGSDYTYPQCDDVVIPTDMKGALTSNKRDGIDIIVGTTKDEMNYWISIWGKDQFIKNIQKGIDSYIPKMSDEQKKNFEKYMQMLPEDQLQKCLTYSTDNSFNCPARYEAKTHAANGQNTYMYYFTEESNNKMLKSYHCYDVGFVFNNLADDELRNVRAGHQLSKTMQQMWVNFAKTGNPSIKVGEVNGVGEIKWDKYSEENPNVMILDSFGTKLQKDPIKEQCDLIADLYWLSLQQ